METLRSLGAGDKLIANIFIIEGSIISILGAFAGIMLGVLLCLIQEKFGIITFGDAASGFVIDRYPVDIVASDVALVFATVIAVGLTAMGIPVKYLTGRLLASSNDNKEDI
jgi:lipoprotein-releasing system permease protein